MDPIIAIQKAEALMKSRSNKKQFHHLLDRAFFYFLALVSCLLLFWTPFWLSEIFCSIKSFLVFHILKVSPSVLNPKVLFILTNVIVIVLVGESKLFGSKPASPTSDSYYEEYVRRSHAWDLPSNESKKMETEFERFFEENIEKSNVEEGKRTNKGFDEGDEHISLPTEELNKRADDLIARVNRQRRLEATFVSGWH